MSLLNNHSAYNKWQSTSGLKLNRFTNIDGYTKNKAYTKNLISQLSYSMKELIVKDICTQKGIRLIDIDNVDEMIKNLNNLSQTKINKFKDLKQNDFFLAFRYLHRQTYQ